MPFKIAPPLASLVALKNFYANRKNEYARCVAYVLREIALRGLESFMTALDFSLFTYVFRYL